MNKRWIVIGMTCLSLLFVQLGQASAAVANGIQAAGQQMYETVLSSTDTALSGVMASRQFYFQTESYWNVREVKINLDYKASPLTRGEQSSVTLVMNGTKFHSFRPAVSEAVKQRLTVTVPRELIVKGSNTLTVEGYIVTNLENQICVPVEKRDNWLQLRQTSSVEVNYRNEALTGSINDFNRHFVGRDMVNANLGAIAVPSKSQPAELEAAVHALSGFAKANSLKGKAIPIHTWDTAALREKQTIVAIGLYDNLPTALQSAIGNEDLSGTALIRVISMDRQPTLVVTSKNPDLLVKAGRLLANQEMVGQLAGTSKRVDANTNVDTPDVTVNRNVTLTEAGDRLTGWMHQEKTYFVSLPANRSIADASKVSLDLRYAKNLDFHRSLVTVLINNTPIGSKKLTSEMANGDTFSLPIPKNLDVTGNFSVTVAFDLELENVTCVQPQDQMPWAYITKDSLLQLNTKDKTDLLFNNYPNPFLRDGGYNQVAVVMPQVKDSYTYLALSNLFNLLGQYAEGNTGDVKFYEDSAAAKVLQERNIIAIGSYHNNKIFQDPKLKLYFQYDSKGDGFISNEKMSIDTDYGKRMGTLQLLDSPYEPGHGLLAVTGAGSEYYYLASKLLASESTKWKVYGDGVATDKDGNIHAYRFKKQTEQESKSVLDDVLERGDVLGFMVAAVLVMLLVLVALILMIRKYRKKRGAGDETESK
ncbi:cellulose biosynthesis cyclic di-GMP-binding regulatory protein BcsB [Paenibacillus sp. ACRRX]|uniref:cellulose biosynthesis cyclic di-GMP-binding regulatory protein BcsB n=1 Tax=Paenibacillus sp. ACRRX TaxID=2918206 RepID=UPI001EF71519|nr:cellulose biosynthesis cyclic di-GMP-binding regulatory protein BcsB [Paenibacillus sp. ACRRX]